ncbi:MAG: hypothetical protein K0A93_10955 [Desulfuromonadaceae bacterium]|nr:hypothetical protein [Desulfuromonadaceae bacterium]
MKQLVFFVIFLGLTQPLWAASGVKGRAAWRGELVPGVSVRAYRAVADIALGKEVGRAETTALDGTYQLDLPPGEYFLTARDYPAAPQPGDHFCYYSGSPVRVVAGRYTNVGFNLIRVPQEAPPQPGTRSAIEGEITFQGKPLEKVYLYVYNDPENGFKGPGYLVHPVEKGTFRLRLPPGDYYLLARKRLKGGRYGPIEIGDYFNYYYGNPVRIEAGEVRDIHIETITRLSMLEADDPVPFHGVRGVVHGGGKEPVAGIYVFAYATATMTGTPDYFSAPTGADGRFELPLPGDGPYHLLARQEFGGPATNEFYGRLAGPGLRFDAQTTTHEVTINVEQLESR